MPYAVKLEYDDEYVLLEYIGRVTRDEHETGRAEAIRALTDKGWIKLLVDASEVDPEMSVGDDFRFTKSHQSTHPLLVRIAVLHRPDELERFRFIENVAVNRALDLKIFTEFAEAINWLNLK